MKKGKVSHSLGTKEIPGDTPTVRETVFSLENQKEVISIDGELKMKRKRLRRALITNRKPDY